MKSRQAADSGSGRRELARSSQTLLRPNATLSTIEIFRELPAAAVQELSKRCRWHRYEAHQTVIRCHDSGREVFFLVRGRACAIYQAASGREVRFSELSAGEIFGEFAAIDGEPRSADVVTLSEALIASMAAEAFWAALRQHEAVATATLCRLTRIARMMLQRVVEFSTLSVRDRIHAELLRLGRVSAPGPGRCTAIIAPAPTHAAIASRISTHREAVARELSELARAGLVAKRNGALIIHDVVALAEKVRGVVEGPCWAITFPAPQAGTR
jgi:CRP/FNR family transcriptional regulator, cyclic AMP receptor protein